MIPKAINNNEILINSLNYRLKSIETKLSIIKTRPDNKDLLLNLYKETSYLVHFILSDDSLRILFYDLLEYLKNIYSSQDFKETASKLRAIFIEISNELVQSFSNNEYIKTSGNFKNPFYEVDTVIAYPLTDFPAIFKNVHENSLTFKRLKESHLVLGSIIENINRFTHATSDILITKINETNQLIEQLEYKFVFLYDYSGAKSASNINFIYEAFNPIFFSKGILSTNVLILQDALRKGEEIYSISKDELIDDCQKIVQYLINSITNQLSKNVSIERFKAFIELYKIGAFGQETIENDLQKEFEQFLFIIGFFPLSEIQFKNSRIDTLAINKGNIILYEYKLIKSDSDISDKLINAKIQISKYQGLLNTLPELTRDVHIVLYTFIPIAIKNDNNYIERNSVIFYFHIVNLFDINTSKIHATKDIDLNELF